MSEPQKPTLTVKIDVHEPADFWVYFDNLAHSEAQNPKSKYIINVTKEALPVGDFIINDVIIIERKTASDFVSSLMNKNKDTGGSRIFEQIDNLCEVADAEHRYLIVERYLTTRQQWTTFPLSAVIAAYIEIAKKVCTYTARDMNDTKHFLKTLLFHSAPDKEPSAKTIRAKKTEKSPEELELFILCGLPDISAKRGQIILNKYDNVGDFFNALKTPEGIFALGKIFPENYVKKWSEIVWKNPIPVNTKPDNV